MRVWDRKRSPSEVPEDVVAAVTEACARLGGEATQDESRAALTLVDPREDFRVSLVLEQAGEGAPANPWALVDLVSGTSAPVVQARSACGYYELLRGLVKEREERDVREERDEREHTPAAPASAPRSSAPAPRGRFTQLPPQRRPFAELLEVPARRDVESRLAQHEHRFALRRALNDECEKTRGASISTDDVVSLFERHGLHDELVSSERRAILEKLKETKGALGRTAWALGISTSELTQLVRATGLEATLEEARDRYRREALAPANLRSRLDLLGRSKYLADLGIETRFREALRDELSDLLREASGAGERRTLTELARARGLPIELLSRAVDKLGLAREPATPIS